MATTDADKSVLAPPRSVRGYPRVLLVLTVATSLFIVFWRGRSGAELPGGSKLPGAAIVVTLAQGNGYGEAVLFLGNDAAKSTPASLDDLASAVTRSLDSAGRVTVHVRASGGVRQREMERLRSVIMRVAGGRPVDCLLYMSKGASVGLRQHDIPDEAPGASSKEDR